MRLKYLKYDVRNGLRKVKTRTALALSALALTVSGGGGLAIATFGIAHATPVPLVVYSSLASVEPTTNYPSQPFQAQQTSEFGDYVHLAGTARQLDSIDLTMSNWAKEATPANLAWCESNPGSCSTEGFIWPITVNIYASTLDANDVPTTKLGSKTVDVHVPWRPASDPDCAATSNGNGWKENGNCVNLSGLAFNAHFDLNNLSLNLPNDVIVGFAYNTQSYGITPTGVDGPYNSLNIAIPEGQTATVGTDDNSDATFWNTQTVSYYSNQLCTGGTFCLDTNWTPYGTVPMRITALPEEGPLNVPTNKDQCKKDGWKNYNDSSGKPFKNQGLCVSYVASNGKSQH